MDFLSKTEWWAILAGGVFFFALSQIGRYGSGALSPRLQMTGNVGVALSWILAFVTTGWKGLLAVFLVSLPVAVVAVGLLGLARRNPEYRVRMEREHKQILDAMGSPGGMERYSALQDKKLADLERKVARRQDLVSLLAADGKSPEDIEQLYSELARAGTGGYVAEQVLISPSLLAQYLHMKREGQSEPEIAFALIQLVRGY